MKTFVSNIILKSYHSLLPYHTVHNTIVTPIITWLDYFRTPTTNFIAQPIVINPTCTSFSSVAGNDSEYEILNSYLVYYELTKIYCALSLYRYFGKYISPLHIRTPLNWLLKGEAMFPKISWSELPGSAECVPSGPLLILFWLQMSTAISNCWRKIEFAMLVPCKQHSLL